MKSPRLNRSATRALLVFWPFLSVPRVWYLARAGAPEGSDALVFASSVLGLGFLRDGLAVALMLLPIQLAQRFGLLARVPARATLGAALSLLLAALLAGFMLDYEFLRYFGFHSTPTHLVLLTEWDRISSSIDFYVDPLALAITFVLLPLGYLWVAGRAPLPETERLARTPAILASLAAVAVGSAAVFLPVSSPLVAHASENYLTSLLRGVSGGALEPDGEGALAEILGAAQPLPAFAGDERPWRHFDPERPLVVATDHQLCRLGRGDASSCDTDADADGYPLLRDCNDADPRIHPGAAETPRNGIDEDCSGLDADPPNLIFVHWEGVRGVNVGAMGYATPATPRFDALVRDGLLFTNAYANGTQTRWSLISVYCSTLPRLSNRWIFKHDPDLELLCLPDVLRSRGYQTIYVHGGTIDFAGKGPRMRRWFELRYDRTNEPIGQMRKFNWGAVDRDVLDFSWKLLTERTDPRPFFLTIATLAVHHPFGIPEDGFDEQPHSDPRNQLANVIRYTDDALGEFLERLLPDPRFENTLVLVASDHGINWYAPHPQREQNVLWEDMVWVPLALLGAGWNATPGVEPEVRQLADITPTILDRLGIELPNPFIGQSLLRRHGEREPRAFFATANGGPSAGLRIGRYKYFEHFETGERHLFDLERDREERHDLADDPRHAERIERFAGWLRTVYGTHERLVEENRIWSDAYRLDPEAAP